MLAVSADDLSGAEQAARDWGPPFPILYDPGAGVIQDFGVYTGKLAKPSTFVIDKDGVIRWKYIGANKNDRPSPGDVIQQLKAIEG